MFVKFATLLAVLLCVKAASAAAFASHTTVALTGQHAPGTPAGVSYASANDHVVVNGAGQIAYWTSLSGSGVVPANNQAVFSGFFASPQLVARSGDPAPGMPGSNYTNVANPALGDDGNVAFTISSGSFTAIFGGAAASPQLVANAGDPAPGTLAGVNYLNFQRPLVNDAAQVTYFTVLTGAGVTSSNNQALYAGPFSSPQLVARTGDPAPGMPAGVNYSLFSSLGERTLNDTGRIAFHAGLTGAGVTTANNEAIYAGPLASPQPVARAGDAAPGMPVGVNYSTLSEVRLNDGGQVAYTAGLTGTGVTSTNNVAVYAGSAASPQIVARTGDAAPGTAVGVTYSSLGTPALGESSRVAFTASLTGENVTSANDAAMYAGNVISPQLVLREGDPAPGTVQKFSTFNTPAMNDAGQLAFTGDLDSTDSFAKRYLYGLDPQLGPILIARDGSPFDVGGGVMRTIALQGIDFEEGYGDDSRTGLSNDGIVAFKLTFTDGSTGIFTTAIPEPTSAWLLVLGGIRMLARRRA